MANKYFKRSRMSEEQFRLLVRLFVEEHHAKEIAVRVGVNRNSVNRVLLKLRRRIAEVCEWAAERVDVRLPVMVGGVGGVGEDGGVGVEFDEVWVMVKRRVNGDESVIPFGLFKLGDEIYTQLIDVENGSEKQEAWLGGIGGWSGGLAAMIEEGKGGDGQDIYQRVYPAGGGAGGVGDAIYRLRDLGSLESFWDRARGRFARLRGMRDETFYLCLKESEFRHKHREGDLYREVLRMLRERPLV